MSPERRSAWVSSLVLLSAALLLLGSFYATVESRPEIANSVSITSYTVDTTRCPRSVTLVFTGPEAVSVLDDAATLDGIARCLIEGRSNGLELGGVLTIADAEQVAAALEARGVPADQLSTVTFANGLTLCEPADWSCWQQRDTTLSRRAEEEGGH
jgi:hypothetical protein